jgi:hypothetical protein
MKIINPSKSIRLRNEFRGAEISLMTLLQQAILWIRMEHLPEQGKSFVFRVTAFLAMVFQCIFVIGFRFLCGNFEVRSTKIRNSLIQFAIDFDRSNRIDHRRCDARNSKLLSPL